jgi:hypothetical protein
MLSKSLVTAYPAGIGRRKNCALVVSEQAALDVFPVE